MTPTEIDKQEDDMPSLMARSWSESRQYQNRQASGELHNKQVFGSCCESSTRFTPNNASVSRSRLKQYPRSAASEN